VTALATNGRHIYVGTDQGIAQYDSLASDFPGNDSGHIAQVDVLVDPAVQ